MLFGTESGESTSSQSLVFVDDSLGDKPSVELRDGVAIDPVTVRQRTKPDMTWNY